LQESSGQIFAADSRRRSNSLLRRSRRPLQFAGGRFECRRPVSRRMRSTSDRLGSSDPGVRQSRSSGPVRQFPVSIRDHLQAKYLQSWKPDSIKQWTAAPAAPQTESPRFKLRPISLAVVYHFRANKVARLRSPRDSIKGTACVTQPGPKILIRVVPSAFGWFQTGRTTGGFLV